MTTFFVTRSGTWHWTLDCWMLRRTQVGNVTSTEQSPPDPKQLCLDCAKLAGLPAGYEIGTKLSQRTIQASRHRSRVVFSEVERQHGGRYG